MSIGEKIRELRIERNLLQRDLAKKIRIAPNTLSQFENGRANPSYEVLTAIADVFECSTDYLLGREDDFGNITIHTDKPAPLPKDEQKLLETFRKLDETNKAYVSVYATVRLEEQSSPFDKNKKK